MISPISVDKTVNIVYILIYTVDIHINHAYGTDYA